MKGQAGQILLITASGLGFLYFLWQFFTSFGRAGGDPLFNGVLALVLLVAAIIFWKA